MQRSSRWSIVRAAIALTGILVVASCDTPLATTVDGVDRIVLTPSSASVQAGATVTLSALVLDASGNAMRERKVVWASENASIATVSQSGVVTGVAAGTVQVAASSGGKSANATITVTSRPVSLVRVTPGSATIAVAQSTPLQAEALDAAGERVLGRPVTWASSNETIALVSATGVVAGIAPGSVTISATIDGQSGTAAITVAPQAVASVSITPEVDTAVVGRRITFRATPFDARNLPLTGRTINWTSSAPTIATVSSSGEALGLSVGSAKIRATIEGQFAEATFVVQPVPVARVVVAPNQVTLNPGQTSQLTVTLTDSAGNVLIGRTLKYTTTSATVATVSATGLVTAVAEGTAQIDVESEGVRSTVQVTVNPVPVASITITPNAAQVRINQTVQLTAQAFDAQGKPLANRKFTWLSGVPNVATVTQTGEVTAVGNGTAAIFAATEGVSAFATITVSNVPVSSISIVPPSLSLQAGGSSQLSAVTRDANGNVLTGRVVTWSSSNDPVAVVSSLGRVTAVSAGSANISATSEGVVGQALVTVSTVPVATVTVTPTNPSLQLGGTVDMTATMRDASGNILSGRPVTWTTGNSSIATVDATGLVTAVATGSTSVTATSEGQTGSTTITVATVPVASVTVTPSSPQMFPGDVLQFTATARDASGNQLFGRPVVWSSNASGIASVNGSGQVTAVAQGGATITATVDGVGGSTAVFVVTVQSVSLTPNPASVVSGSTQGIRAVVTNSLGGVVRGRNVNWVSNNPSIASVSQVGGTPDSAVITGVATSGSTQIVATDPSGPSSTAPVTVTLVPIASVSVTPPSPSIVVPASVNLTADPKDGSGNSQTRTITWVSLNPSVATVASTGAMTATVTSVASGTATIEARAVGAGAGGTTVTGTSTVTVTAAVATVQLTAPRNFIVPNDTMHTSIVLRDVNGNVLLGKPIVYSTSDAAVATVSASGVITGVGSGPVTITATSEGQSGAVNLSGQAGISSIVITSNLAGDPTPNDISIAAGTKSYSITLTDAGGTPLGGRTVSITSGSTGIATIASPTPVATNGSGQAALDITPVAQGTSTITVTSSARQGVNGSTVSNTITVTVIP